MQSGWPSHCLFIGIQWSDTVSFPQHLYCVFRQVYCNKQIKGGTQTHIRDTNYSTYKTHIRDINYSTYKTHIRDINYSTYKTHIRDINMTVNTTHQLHKYDGIDETDIHYTNASVHSS